MRGIERTETSGVIGFQHIMFMDDSVTTGVFELPDRLTSRPEPLSVVVWMEFPWCCSHSFVGLSRLRVLSCGLIW